MITKSSSFLGLFCLVVCGSVACVGAEPSVDVDDPPGTEGAVGAVAAPLHDGAIGSMCGGLAGIQCPSRLACVDDPNDNCYPWRGDSDCAGICALPSGLKGDDDGP